MFERAMEIESASAQRERTAVSTIQLQEGTMGWFTDVSSLLHTFLSAPPPR